MFLVGSLMTTQLAASSCSLVNIFSTLKMEDVVSSGTSVNLCLATSRHIPEDCKRNLHSDHCDGLKSNETWGLMTWNLMHCHVLLTRHGVWIDSWSY
jgi:hypothetical protein